MTPRAAARLLTVAALAAGLAWSVFLSHLHLDAAATVLDRIEASLLDLRFLARGPQPPPEGVLIVAVDDATAGALKAFPLPRDRMAQLVSSLVGGGAAAVGLDFLFIDPGPPDNDRQLAAALGLGRSVIAATAEFAPTPDGGGRATGCTLPAEAFRRTSALGLVNIEIDRSGTVRHMPTLLGCGAGSLLPSLPLRAASLAAGDDPAFLPDAVEVGGRTVPLDVGRHVALRFYGPEGSIPTVSAIDVLEGRVAAERWRGRIVLVGATARGSGDRYPTPFDTVLPGVEVLATAVANITSGAPLIRTSLVRRVDAALAVALTLAAVLCLTRPRVTLGLVLAPVLILAFVGAAFAAFAQGYWLSMAMPLAAVIPVATATAAARLGVARWSEKRLSAERRTLAAFQSPAVLRRLSDDPEFLSKPVERRIAVVFIDLTGFTGLTERLGAQPTRDILKSFHGLVESQAAASDGLVAAYMADGAMLVWGWGGESPVDAVHAVRSAVALEARTQEWIAGMRPVVGPALTVKLGGHFGSAILSRLGHETHQHITAIGDTVNVASRLMKVAADHGSAIALTAALLDEARRAGLPDDGRFGPPIEVSIRGRDHTVSARLMTKA